MRYLGAASIVQCAGQRAFWCRSAIKSGWTCHLLAPDSFRLLLGLPLRAIIVVRVVIVTLVLHQGLVPLVVVVLVLVITLSLVIGRAKHNDTVSIWRCLLCGGQQPGLDQSVLGGSVPNIQI